MTDPSVAPSILASLSGAEERGRVPPRWYAHSYNRAEFYRLAAAMGWLPRPGPSRARAVSLSGGGAAIPGRSYRRSVYARCDHRTQLLRAWTYLTSGVFPHFSMCFLHLVHNNSPAPSSRIIAAFEASHVLSEPSRNFSMACHDPPLNSPCTTNWFSLSKPMVFYPPSSICPIPLLIFLQ